MDTPVTPPSMKRLDIKNPLSPIPAERIPRTMSVKFTASRTIFFISQLMPHKIVKRWTERPAHVQRWPLPPVLSHCLLTEVAVHCSVGFGANAFPNTQGRQWRER